MLPDTAASKVSAAHLSRTALTRLAAWLRLSRREETWKTAGILILRHQLTVLQRRQPRRPKLNWADRALPRPSSA